MFPDPNFKSDTTRILEHLKVQDQFKERYKTEFDTIIIEKTSSKALIEIPLWEVELIKKYNQNVVYRQILLERFKRTFLDSSTPPGLRPS